MNTDEIKAARDKAEAEILRILQDLGRAAGMTVESIDLEKTYMRPIQLDRPQEIVSRLNINLKL